MTVTIKPFLMFQGQAEEAMKLYAAHVPDTEILRLERAETGKVFHGELRLAGTTVRCFDSPVKHDFTFTPAFSFFVECASEDQLRTLTATLSEGGATLMPLASYGFSKLFCWCVDRFGVAWQLNWA